MLKIASAKLSDVPVINKLACGIWPDAYKNILSKDQMNYMLELIYSPSSLKKQIKNLHHQFRLVYENDIPVGFASYSQYIGSTNAYKLHKIYVLQNQQGKGIGKFIINEIINEIKPAGAKFLRLNVNRRNPALDFYKKIGFKIIAQEDVDIDNGYFMNDYVMEKRID